MKIKVIGSPIWLLVTSRGDTPTLCVVGEDVRPLDEVTPKMLENVLLPSDPNGIGGARLLWIAHLFAFIFKKRGFSLGEMDQYVSAGGPGTFRKVDSLSEFSETLVMKIIDLAPLEFSLREFKNDTRFKVLAYLIQKTPPEDVLAVFGDRGGNVGILAELRALGDGALISDPVKIQAFMEVNGINEFALRDIEYVFARHAAPLGNDFPSLVRRLFYSEPGRYVSSSDDYNAVVTVGLETFQSPDWRLGYNYYLPRICITAYAPTGCLFEYEMKNSGVDPRVLDKDSPYGIYVRLCSSPCAPNRPNERLPLATFLNQISELSIGDLFDLYCSHGYTTSTRRTEEQ